MKEFIKIVLAVLLLIVLKSNILAQNDLGLVGASVVCGFSTEFYNMNDILDKELPGDYYEFVKKEYAWEVDKGSFAPNYSDYDEFSNDEFRKVIDIDWDNVCSKGKIVAKYKLTYEAFTYNNMGNAIKNSSGNYVTVTKSVVYKQVLEVKIKQNYSSITINGPDKVPCIDAADSLTYSISACAEKYTWVVPSGWTMTGQGTSSIQVVPDPYNGGNITVSIENQDDNPCGTPYFAEAKLEVSRECPADETYLLRTSNLPSHTAVKDFISVRPREDDGSNPLGGILFGPIKVLSGQQVRFKAGNYINIKPGFSVGNGGYFTAKIGPCSSCLAFRVGNNDEDRFDDVLEDQSTLNFKIYPNPNKGQFNIELNSDGENVLVEVYDVVGKQVFSKNNVDNILSIDLKDETKGIYFVRVTVGDKVFNEKVVYN